MTPVTSLTNGHGTPAEDGSIAQSTRTNKATSSRHPAPASEATRPKKRQRIVSDLGATVRELSDRVTSLTEEIQKERNATRYLTDYVNALSAKLVTSEAERKTFEEYTKNSMNELNESMHYLSKSISTTGEIINSIVQNSHFSASSALSSLLPRITTMPYLSTGASFSSSFPNAALSSLSSSMAAAAAQPTPSLPFSYSLGAFPLSLPAAAFQQLQTQPQAYSHSHQITRDLGIAPSDHGSTQLSAASLQDQGSDAMGKPNAAPVRNRSSRSAQTNRRKQDFSRLVRPRQKATHSAKTRVATTRGSDAISQSAPLQLPAERRSAFHRPKLVLEEDQAHN